MRRRRSLTTVVSALAEPAAALLALFLGLAAATLSSALARALLALFWGLARVGPPGVAGALVPPLGRLPFLQAAHMGGEGPVQCGLFVRVPGDVKRYCAPLDTLDVLQAWLHGRLQAEHRGGKGVTLSVVRGRLGFVQAEHTVTRD